MTDDIMNFFSVDHYIPRCPSKIFMLIGCGVLHMQLWHHNEGTYDVIKKKSDSFPLRSTCYMPSLNFFLGVASEREVRRFSILPIWLPHHVTYDVIIIIQTFYMSSHTNVVNFVSIQQAVVEKNTKVLCGQTNTNTNTNTDKQMDPNAELSPNPSARATSYRIMISTGL